MVIWLANHKIDHLGSARGKKCQMNGKLPSERHERYVVSLWYTERYTGVNDILFWLRTALNLSQFDYSWHCRCLTSIFRSHNKAQTVLSGNVDTSNPGL